ncbi:hypothetical protein [Trinickia symbiotica]|uniref:hypothetical protein n=1 Tax=Trinickia symbiotica TaxID=863227 RepID=UPI000475F224
MYLRTRSFHVRLAKQTGYALRVRACRLAGSARIAGVLGAILGPQLAFAGGGLDSATQGATTFKIWLYTFLGVCAACVLMWKGAECWADRAHWSEFVSLAGKVAVVGSVVGVLAPYLWNMFS